MKVFLVGDFPKDDKIYGGVEGVLINLTNEFIKHQDVELILGSLSTKSELKRFEGKCPIYKLDLKKAPFKSKKIFQQIVLKEKPDIIHVQGVVPGSFIFHKEYANIFTVTQHAILKEERLWQASTKRRILFRIKELFERQYLRKIQNLIFISKYNRDIYFETYSNTKSLKYDLIPNSVNPVFFKKPVLNRNKENDMYFVGEIKKRKGLHVLIRAIAHLKKQDINCRVHVIGGFKEAEYKKEILALISTLKVSKSIIFCGWKKQAEIMEYTEGIPIFVLPSFQETLPLSIAEAMCQGKIVVASDICGIPEMIQHEVSGYLFPKGDYIALAEVLKSVFKADQNLISKKAIVESKRYHPEDVIEKTIRFYQQILNSNLKTPK